MKLKIGLIGDGKMGQLIKDVSATRGHQIVGITSRVTSDTQNVFADTDILIDFSHGEHIGKALSIAARLKVPLVTGTTGYDMSVLKEPLSDGPLFLGLKAFVPPFGLTIDEWRSLKQKGVLYAPNFATEVLDFIATVQATAALPSLRTHSVRIIETHHVHKKDAPSGTAKQLATIISDARRQPLSEIQIESIRKGEVVGRHEVHFESPNATFTLISDITNRRIFAEGAVDAAEQLYRLSVSGNAGIKSLIEHRSTPVMMNPS